MEYSEDQLLSIYTLGKMYLEMGYFVPAERVFSGLVKIDKNFDTPANVGLGLLRLYKGQHQESTAFFRLLLQSPKFSLFAKLGLAAAFLGLKEFSRARLLLLEVQSEYKKRQINDTQIKSLIDAFYICCN